MQPSIAKLTVGAQNIMSRLKEMGYRHGDYLAAGRLFYIFNDQEEKKRSLDELVAGGLITIAPNGSIGITPAGEHWNDGGGSAK